MDLKQILTVPGKTGLFRLVSQGKNSIIVESLIDNSRMPVFASTRASSLDDICVFTTDEDMPLKDVFKRMFDAKKGIKVESTVLVNNSELKKIMKEALPQYDMDRVHVSDMKKMFTWYNILHDNNMLSFEEKVSTQESEENKEKEDL